MPGYDYDLFVIGGGFGGVRAARIAAGHGAKVAIAEEYRYGGTCVIRGCVPKKLLVYAGRYHGEFEDAAGFGWTIEGARFDWKTLIANKDKEIGRLEGIYRGNLVKAGVKTFAARAEIVDRHTVSVAGEAQAITAKYILVATGAAPFVPAIPGAEHAITSDEAFHLEQLPKGVVIAGGGYIALEFASIFNGLGAKVTVVYRGEQILRGFDGDLRDDLAAAMKKRGIVILTNADITAISDRATTDGRGRLAAELNTGAKLEAEVVMFATGRRPNTHGLGLENARVQTGVHGEIVVGPDSRSNIESIYAVGDVTNRANLTPVAIREGHAFADTVFGNRPWTADHEMIPTAVFSEPEVATVGLAEHAAREWHGEIDIYKARFRPMKYTLPGREERMLMKLVVEAKTQKVVGCHVLGPDAGEIVQMAAIAMRMGATKADFDRTMALHPSAAEELVTMREKWVPPKA